MKMSVGIILTTLYFKHTNKIKGNIPRAYELSSPLSPPWTPWWWSNSFSLNVHLREIRSWNFSYLASRVGVVRWSNSQSLSPACRWKKIILTSIIGPICITYDLRNAWISFFALLMGTLYSSSDIMI